MPWYVIALILAGIFGACVAIGAVLAHWETKP